MDETTQGQINRSAYTPMARGSYVIRDRRIIRSDISGQPAAAEQVIESVEAQNLTAPHRQGSSFSFSFRTKFVVAGAVVGLVGIIGAVTALTGGSASESELKPVSDQSTEQIEKTNYSIDTASPQPVSSVLGAANQAEPPASEPTARAAAPVSRSTVKKVVQSSSSNAALLQPAPTSTIAEPISGPQPVTTPDEPEVPPTEPAPIEEAPAEPPAAE